MTTQETNSCVLIELDTTNQSATYHKIGTKEALESYAVVLQSILLPDQVLLLVDLNAECYGLSLNQQETVQVFIIEHSLNATTYAFAQSIHQEDNAKALTALKTMLAA